MKDAALLWVSIIGLSAFTVPFLVAMARCALGDQAACAAIR